MRIMFRIHEAEQVIVYKDKAKMLHLLHEALTELHAVQLIMSSLPFAHIHVVFQEASIVTTPFFNSPLLIILISSILQSCCNLYYYNQCFLNTVWTRVKGNDDMISCATSVSVSTSYSRCNVLASNSCIITCSPCVL